MLTHFICPDRGEIKIEDCLKQCRCPDGNGLRCMDKSVLLFIANGRRPWTGKPSCTQITGRLMQSYLQSIYPFAESPRECLFRLYGSMLHLGLEIKDPDLLVELPLENDFITGRLDTYCISEQAISDHKYVSSFQVKDFEDGKKEDYILQLNIYKYLFEEQFPQYPVRAIVSNVYVRDWNKRTAATKGIKRAYRIAQPILPKARVKETIEANATTLRNAIETRTAPPACHTHERYFNPKEPDQVCKSYCSVNTYCPYFLQNYGADVRKFA